MTFLKSILTAAILGASAATGAMAQESCADDPRMLGIADFVSAKAAGPVEPMRLTAETFFNLTPKAREVMGDDIVVLNAACEPVQIYGGEPPAKIEVPFSTIYNGLFDAAARGDQQTADVILSAFRSAPMPSEAVHSLITNVTAPEAVKQRLSDYTDVALVTKDDLHNRKCEVTRSLILLSDLYIRTGGKIDDNGEIKVTVLPRSPGNEIHTLPSSMETEPVTFSQCYLTNAAYTERLTAMGAISIINPDVSFQDHQRDPILKWIEDRSAGSDTPLSSLFE